MKRNGLYDSPPNGILPGGCVRVDKEYEKQQEEASKRRIQAARSYITTGLPELNKDGLSRLTFWQQKELAYAVKCFLAEQKSPTDSLESKRANDFFALLNPDTVEIAQKKLDGDIQMQSCCILL